MNKKQIVKNLKKKGWRVSNPDTWNLVEEQERVKLYQADVVTESKESGTVTFKVIDENNVNEDGKNIEMVKLVAEDLQSFDLELRTYLDTLEEDESIFAVTVDELNSIDQLALLTVYLVSGQQVTLETRVCAKRNGVFATKVVK